MIYTIGFKQMLGVSRLEWLAKTSSYTKSVKWLLFVLLFVCIFVDFICTTLSRCRVCCLFMILWPGRVTIQNFLLCQMTLMMKKTLSRSFDWSRIKSLWWENFLLSHTYKHMYVSTYCQIQTHAGCHNNSSTRNGKHSYEHEAHKYMRIRVIVLVMCLAHAHCSPLSSSSWVTTYPLPKHDTGHIPHYLTDPITSSVSSGLSCGV